MMKNNVIQIAENIYSPAFNVVQNVVIDMLTKLTTCNVHKTYVSCFPGDTHVAIEDNKIVRYTWEGYHGSGDTIREVLTDNKDDVYIVQTAINLCKIYNI